jgi:BMFP domain-containing protein YqiC
MPAHAQPNRYTAMFDTTALNDLARRLAEAMPADFQALKSDMERNFHAILQASFSKMNLVSREEFEVQSAVLARTREHLEGLEARVAELEKQILDR